MQSKVRTTISFCPAHLQVKAMTMGHISAHSWLVCMWCQANIAIPASLPAAAQAPASQPALTSWRDAYNTVASYAVVIAINTPHPSKHTSITIVSSFLQQ